MKFVILGLSLCIILFVTGISEKKQRTTAEEQNDSHEENRTCSIPPICECIIIRGMLTANCESKNISSDNIPKFDENVTAVILNSNNINKLPKKNHFGSQLLHLHLRNNFMSAIDPYAFQYLSNLIVLDLADNQLTTHSDILQPGVFRDLVNLQYLHLGNNSFSTQSAIEYPDKALGHLVSLRNLTIDGQANKSFGPGFETLTHLEHLHFSGLYKVCQIFTLMKTIFQYLTHLKIIDASSCNIYTVERFTFSSLRNLTHLNLSYNTQLGFKVLQNITHDLQFTSIKILELAKVHSTFGLGIMISREAVSHLGNTSLEVLKLDSNRLELFEVGVLTLMPDTLHTLSLTDNKLTYDIYVYEFLNLGGLKVLNGTQQFHTHDIMNDMNFRYNNLNVPQRRGQREPITYLHHSDDSSSTVYLETNINLTCIHPFSCFPLPPNVETVDFSSSALYFPLHKILFPQNSLRRLYLANNLFNEMIGPIIGLSNLKLLDLSNIFCFEVSLTFFDTFQNLSTLYLQKNVLGFSLRLDENGEIFKNLSKLQKLDISQNRIDVLPKRIFRGLLNIKSINLRNNSLTECNFSLSHMRKLQLLDLSFNQLSSLSNNLMNYLDTRVGDNISVNTEGNVFECNCKTLDFVEWFRNKQSIFKSHETSLCRYNGQLKKMIEINLSELTKTCTSYAGLIIGAIVIILLILSTITAGLVYRFRWKLRYLYYMAKNRYNGYTPVHNEVDDDYTYDAFIAYSDLQRKFVTNDMIQHLEKDAGLSLCIHHRDFTPGNEIGANITDAINKSRRTVAVVSRDFLQSYWCMFELNMARMESIYSRDGRNTMFLILYENDCAGLIPLEFYDLIDTDSYIEYPNDPQGNIVFWNKVRESLRVPE